MLSSVKFMSNIKTYEDLLAEQKRLEGILYSHKESIKDNIAGIKRGLKPFNLVFNTVSKAVSRDKISPLFNFGLDLAIDLIVRKFILAKAGWLTKVVVPFIIKNYTTHLAFDYHKSKIIGKIKSIIKKSRFRNKESQLSVEPGTFDSINSTDAPDAT